MDSTLDSRVARQCVVWQVKRRLLAMSSFGGIWVIVERSKWRQHTGEDFRL